MTLSDLMHRDGWSRDDWGYWSREYAGALLFMGYCVGERHAYGGWVTIRNGGANDDISVLPFRRYGVRDAAQRLKAAARRLARKAGRRTP